MEYFKKQKEKLANKIQEKNNKTLQQIFNLMVELQKEQKEIQEEFKEIEEASKEPKEEKQKGNKEK